jgi:hypothetical protein
MIFNLYSTCKDKNYAFAEVLSPQKILGPQIANPQIPNLKIATFAEGPQIFKKNYACKFADLRFAKLIWGPLL